MKYIVGVQEVHVQNIEVEADSPEEALAEANRRIEEGDDFLYDEYPLVYSHTLETDVWAVNELK